jgi:acid phosphatase
MRYSTSFVVASLASLAVAAPASPTATDTADVYAAQATALTLSPTSNVKGAAFDKYVSIWFENTDYNMATADRKRFPSVHFCGVSSYPNSQLPVLCQEGNNS